MRNDYSHIQGKDPRVTAELKIKNGAPRIFIDGEEMPPFMFFGNTEVNDWRNTLADEFKLAAKHGVHMHSMVMNIPLADEEDFSHFNETMEYVLKNDPEAKIFLRVNVPRQPLEAWKTNDADGLGVYEDNRQDIINIYHEKWIEQGTAGLVHLVRYIQSIERYDKSVIGYHLFPPGIGEWMSMMGHVSGVDTSPAATRRFNEYLTDKYKTDEAISRAWGKAVELGNIKIPIPPCNINIREDKNPKNKIFVDLRANPDIADLYDFISDFNIRMMDELSEAVKRATNFKSLVMNFYGYLFELGDPKTGHNSLGKLLKSPYVDILCSPIGYLDRMEGGYMSYMSPVDTILAAGKLWFVEDDTKTYLSPDDGKGEGDPFNHKVSNLENTLEIHRRNMLGIISRGTGIWWMDLWANGWLNSPEMWENNQKLIKTYLQYK